MKILILGDITGRKTVEFIGKNLWNIRKENSVDMVVANGENATDIMGLSQEDAKSLLDFGVDVITGGNHIFQNKSLYPMLEDSPFIIRPANCASGAVGTGETVFDCMGTRVLVFNLLGIMGMECSNSPFDTADRILKRNEGRYDIALADIHAESTAEKQAMGYYLDGRVCAVFGTHTHVQTADEQILPCGTAYITDLGMCGPDGGILGTSRDVILRRFTTGMPQKFTVADGEIHLRGLVLTERNGKATDVSRFFC